jgi:putative transposase
MYQAKHRFQISIFDYIITSNHIHLLAVCDEEENHIAKTMHLVSGAIAREYNRQNGRSGSFWGDRYSAVAVESDIHLLRCLTYIATNMVRAGVVKHPTDWEDCGYHELIGRKKEHSLIHRECLMNLLDTDELNFQETYKMYIEEYLVKKEYKRECYWTESIAVGNQEFVNGVKSKLGYKAKGRRVVKESDFFYLR